MQHFLLLICCQADVFQVHQGSEKRITVGLMGMGGVSQTTLLLPNRFYPENVGIGPKIFLTSKSLFQNAVVLRRPRVDIFGDIMKVVTMFTKTIFKDSLYFLI